jgi:hypothetical protein
LQIDKLSVEDLGGATFSARGRIIASGPDSPQGNIRVDLDAPDLAPVITLLSRFAPEAAQMIGRRAAAMSPAKLHTQFLLTGAEPVAIGKIAVDGNLGKMNLTLNGQATIDRKALDLADMHLAGELNVDDGKVLMTALGLEHILVIEAGSGAVTFSAEGPAHGALRLKSKLVARGLEVDATGTASLFAENPSLVLDHVVARANVSRLHDGNTQTALPFTYAGRVVLAGQKLTLSDINATLGTKSLRGKIELSLAQRRLQGEVDAEDFDGADLFAAMIGMPVKAVNTNEAWSWPREPFIWKMFGDYDGTLTLKAHRINLLPNLMAREFRTVAA